MSVTADWNDVDASVDLAASRAEMSLVRAVTQTDSSRMFLLRTIRDEPAWIVAELEQSDTNTGEGAKLVLRAKVGRFGDAAREARLLEHVRHRLRQLSGVDVHEIK